VIAVDKILAVAGAEIRALLRSKAFLVSVCIVPMLTITVNLLQRRMAGRADPTPREFAVIDPGDRYFAAIVQAAQARNAALDSARAATPRFIPRPVNPAESLEPLRLALSDQIRQGSLFAFVEIQGEPDREPLRYHSDHPAYDDLREWLEKVVDDAQRAERYRMARLDPALVDALSRHVKADSLGLYQRRATGQQATAAKQDVMRAVFVPMVPAFMLFFFVVLSTPQLMHAVLTEKMSRISEVLLGSVSPFELMAGKLLGSLTVSLLLVSVYAVSAVSAAARIGLASAIPLSLLGWFVCFLLLALLLYGSAFVAIGSACTDVKDAQNLMLPIMLPLTVPLMLSAAVVESPSSSLAVALSLFPLSAPIVMLLRVGLHPSPPLWQVVLSALLTLATTVGCIWAAGRIFRIGLLSQGKSASFRQMARWIFTR
jgi:ABC-2 type transport system permease protein